MFLLVLTTAPVTIDAGDPFTALFGLAGAILDVLKTIGTKIVKKMKEPSVEAAGHIKNYSK